MRWGCIALVFATACSRSQLDAAPPPPPRVLLFGGVAVQGPGALSDTWSFDGVAWTKLADDGPSPRKGAMMAPLAGRVVLFGGMDASGTALSDTWEFDGAWHMSSATGPSARAFGSMATLGNTVVLLGGTASGIPANDALDDMWTFDGTSWTLLDVTGPYLAPFGLVNLHDELVVWPDSNDYGSIAWTFDGTKWTHVPNEYDLGPIGVVSMATAGSVIVSFGTCGFETNECFVFDGSHWTDHTDFANGPPARGNHAMASFGSSAMIFGGFAPDFQTALGDTWIWQGQHWVKQDVVGPPARFNAAMSAW